MIRGKKFLILMCGISLIIVSLIIKMMISSMERIESNYIPFSDVTSENIDSFLTIDSIVIRDNNYYVIRKYNYLYVLKLKEKDIKVLNNCDDVDYIRITGISKLIEDKKDEITEAYNKNVSQRNIIKSDNLNKQFGLYYLDVKEVKDIRNASNIIQDLATFLLEVGIVVCVFSLIIIILERRNYIYEREEIESVSV